MFRAFYGSCIGNFFPDFIVIVWFVDNVATNAPSKFQVITSLSSPTSPSSSSWSPGPWPRTSSPSFRARSRRPWTWNQTRARASSPSGLEAGFRRRPPGSRPRCPTCTKRSTASTCRSSRRNRSACLKKFPGTLRRNKFHFMSWWLCLLISEISVKKGAVGLKWKQVCCIILAVPANQRVEPTQKLSWIVLGTTCCCVRTVHFQPMTKSEREFAFLLVQTPQLTLLWSKYSQS